MPAISTSRCATLPGRRTRQRVAPCTRVVCSSARRASSTSWRSSRWRRSAPTMSTPGSPGETASAGATVSRSRIMGSTSSARSIIRTTASGATSRARTRARAVCFEKKIAGVTPPENPFKKSVFGVTLAGCPLEEKISEFHKLRAEGWPLAALAVICVDNPLVAGTGHRICNDCMKSCIYQKTDPSTFRRRRPGS